MRRRRRNPVLNEHEPNLFNYAGFSLVEDLKSVDIANMTPVQALNKLQELQDKAKDI